MRFVRSFAGGAMLSCRSSCKVRTRKKSIHPRSPNPESCNSSLQNEQMPFCLKASCCGLARQGIVMISKAGCFWVWLVRFYQRELPSTRANRGAIRGSGDRRRGRSAVRRPKPAHSYPRPAFPETRTDSGTRARKGRGGEVGAGLDRRYLHENS